MKTKKFVDLMEWWNKYKYKPYEKIDMLMAGEKECDAIYLDQSITAREKEELANGLLEILIESFKYEGKAEDVIRFIKRFPIIDYYFIFIDKIKILLKERMITKEELFITGKYYANECEESEGIKLGLTLLRFADNIDALEILKIYSNHNEFIFYCIEAIKEYSMCNSIIFNIAKASNGYGKIIAVSNLEPLTEEIKEWIIEEGSLNNILEEVLLILKFNEYDYLNYFGSGRKTKNKYEIFTRNLKLLCQIEDTLREYITFEIINLYFEYYKKFDINFDNLYVMYSMLMLLYDEDNKMASELSEFEKELRDNITNKILSYNYEEIIKDEISFGSYDKKIAIDIASVFDIELKFNDFKDILKYEPFNNYIYQYILEKEDKLDKNNLIKFACENIDFDKINYEKETIYEEEINKEYIDYRYAQDIALYLIISDMEDLAKDYIDINIKALKTRYIATRRAAFANLKNFYEYKSKEINEEIKIACSLEDDKNLKRSMERFLNNRNDEEKESRFINIEDIKVKPHSKDIFLLQTHIAGIKYRDLTIIEEKLIKGKEVFLKREKDNLYDKNSIMILADNGYLLGYIPKSENVILKNLIDYGKIIYGEITDISEDFSEIKVDLFLSYVDVIEEVSATLNMMADESIGYLN